MWVLFVYEALLEDVVKLLPANVGMEENLDENAEKSFDLKDGITTWREKSASRAVEIPALEEI